MTRTEVSRSTRTWAAVLTLFFLAALIPETVATYNSPPLLLLTRPWDLLFLGSFYGSVALLVREFRHHRPVRWTSVLLLGMAAGAINEGIIAGTWYEAKYKGYVLIGGVDPAVAVGLTVFHTLVSTVLPIVLADLIFPAIAGRRWLGRRGVTTCSVLLILVTATGFVQAAHRGIKAVVLLGVIIAVAVALALPTPAPRQISARNPPGVTRLLLAGMAAMVAFFAVFAILPGIAGSLASPADLGPWQAGLVLAMCTLFGLVVATGRTWTGRSGWGYRQTLAVVTGALLPAIILSLLLPAAWRGLEPVATLPMLALLIRLSRLKQPRAATEPSWLPLSHLTSCAPGYSLFRISGMAV